MSVLLAALPSISAASFPGTPHLAHSLDVPSDSVTHFVVLESALIVGEAEVFETSIAEVSVFASEAGLDCVEGEVIFSRFAARVREGSGSDSDMMREVSGRGPV